MRIDYRRRLDDGSVLCATINVPDEKWERAFDYCNQYFCGHLPPLPEWQPPVPAPLMRGRGRRGSSR